MYRVEDTIKPVQFSHFKYFLKPVTYIYDKNADYILFPVTVTIIMKSMPNNDLSMMIIEKIQSCFKVEIDKELEDVIIQDKFLNKQDDFDDFLPFPFPIYKSVLELSKKEVLTIEEIETLSNRLIKKDKKAAYETTCYADQKILCEFYIFAALLIHIQDDLLHSNVHYKFRFASEFYESFNMKKYMARPKL